MDFSTIEITSKKHAEMTWKFAEIWSSSYRRNIHVESLSGIVLIRKVAVVDVLASLLLYLKKVNVESPMLT